MFYPPSTAYLYVYYSLYLYGKGIPHGEADAHHPPPSWILGISVVVVDSMTVEWMAPIL